jgi:hypothetical protein
MLAEEDKRKLKKTASASFHKVFNLNEEARYSSMEIGGLAQLLFSWREFCPFSYGGISQMLSIRVSTAVRKAANIEA